MAVPAGSIVERFDVISDSEPCACFRCEALPVIYLVLQHREEARGDGVVPTHPGASHGHPGPDARAIGGVSGGGVLIGFNRSMQHLPFEGTVAVRGMLRLVFSIRVLCGVAC